MPYRTVLLDLDGTLIDHFAAIHRCHAHVRRHLGLPEPTLAEVRRAVGGGLENAMRRLLGPEHAGKLEAALPVYRDHWDRTLLDDVVLLPGATELLAALRLREVRSAVLTNKLGDSARRICTHLGLDPLLAGVFGAGDTPWLKPDTRFTRHALDRLQADPATTLLIGDSPYDVETARTAGLIIWAVPTGTHSTPELEAAGAHLVLPDLFAIRDRLDAG
jgi:phosphoglycolate phosphatase